VNRVLQHLSLVLLAVGAFCLALGTYGYWLELSCAIPPMTPWLHASESFYRSLMLFFLEGDNLNVGHTYNHWTLHVARLFAPLVTFGAVYQSLSMVFRRWNNRRDVSSRKDHLLIFGSGEVARALAVNESGRHSVVHVITDGDADEIAPAANNLITVSSGRLTDETLKRVRLRRAANIVVAAEGDNANLCIADALEAFLDRTRKQPSVTDRVTDLLNRIRGRPSRVAADIYVRVETPYLRAQVNDHRIRERMTSTTPQATLPVVLIHTFSIDELAVNCFTNEINLLEVADLLAQERMHLLLVGMQGLALPLLAELLKTTTSLDLQPPLVTVISADAARDRDRLYAVYPEIDAVCTIRFTAYDGAARYFAASCLAQIEGDSPVTAAFVALGDDGVTIDAGLTLRRESARHDHLRVPVFLLLNACDGVRGHLDGYFSATCLQDIIHPLQEPTATVRLAHIKRPFDDLAKALHEEYRGYSRKQPLTEDDTRVPWDELQWKYKQSNRRQARHLPAKLYSRGIVRIRDARADLAQPLDGPGMKFARDVVLYDSRALGHAKADADRSCETLSELEHRSWMVGSYLEGWRAGEAWSAGERIDTRLIHKHLVDFDLLDPVTQQYDRENIGLTNRFLQRSHNRAGPGGHADYRNDVWVGIIGAVLLRNGDVDGLERFVDESVSEIAGRLPDYHFTLVSPLAPGVDLFATQRAVGALREKGIPCRIVVPRAVPLHVTVGSFRSAYDDGAVWAPAALHAGRETPRDWQEDCKRVERDMAAATARLLRDCPGSRLLNIQERDRVFGEPAQRQRGYQRQAAYVCRSHILIAAQLDVQRRPGGTTETIDWWKGASTMPPGLGSWRQRPNTLGELHKRLFVHRLGGVPRHGARPAG